MEWAARTRWRKALIFSFLLHSLVLTGAGWLAEKTIIPADAPEALVELELVSEAEIPSLMAANADNQANLESLPTTLQSIQAPQAKILEVETALNPASAVSTGVMDVVGDDDAAKLPVSHAVESGSNPSTNGDYGSRKKARDISPPGILSHREPAYPEKARQAGFEGTVILRIEILENGRPGNVIVQESSGSELLDAAAVAAIERWRFVPAKVRATGQTIVCYTTMPVVFKLKA